MPKTTCVYPNESTLRMSALVLRYKVCREVSHKFLRRNKTERRQDLRGFHACNQDFRPRKYTSYDDDRNIQPSDILCIRVSIPQDTRCDLAPSFVKRALSRDTRHMGHRDRADCLDICQWSMFDIQRHKCVNEDLDDLIDVFHKWDHVSDTRSSNHHPCSHERNLRHNLRTEIVNEYCTFMLYTQIIKISLILTQ